MSKIRFNSLPNSQSTQTNLIEILIDGKQIDQKVTHGIVKILNKISELVDTVKEVVEENDT